MSFSSQFRGYFKNWLYGKVQKQPLHKRPQPAQLFVEMLEDRTLLSTLPAAVVGNSALNFESLVPALPWGGPTIRTQATSPQVIIDPLDPNKIVEVHAVFLNSNLVPQTHTIIYPDVLSGVNTPQWVLEGDYSTDQGRTWTFFSVGQAVDDPAYSGLAPNGFQPYTVIQDVSASFDRNHHFYVVSLQHNTPGAGIQPQQTHISGAIVMQRFDFTSNVPVKDLTIGNGGSLPQNPGNTANLNNPNPGFFGSFNLVNVPGNSIIYQWYDQDPAANPVIGIDTNLPTYTDPTTGAIQTDSMATMVSIPATAINPADLVPKSIYVGYNVLQDFPQPQRIHPGEIPPIQFESRVFLVGSADGGRSFTNQELASDLEHFFNDFNPSNPATPVPLTGTEASSPQIVFSQGGAQKPSFFTYNGVKSASFLFDVTTATPAQLINVFDTIPALNNNLQVTYIGGGSPTKNVAGATYAITFLNGTSPNLLNYDGPGTLTPTGGLTATFTDITATAGGQMMVFYNDFFNGFNRIYYDVSRPDNGDPATPAVAASIFSNNQTTFITDGRGGTPNVVGVTDNQINVNFANTGINGTNLGLPSNGINLASVTDLTVTVALVHPNIDQLSIVLLPPPGLPAVTLLRFRVDAAGKVVMPDGRNPQGLPGGASIGEIPVPTNPINYVPVGTVFDDNAPRPITDTTTAVAPWVGHYQPEDDNPDQPIFYEQLGLTGSFTIPTVGVLTALIQTPNFMQLANGVWTLELTDTQNSGTTPPPQQFLDYWSLNFTGRIATTQGTFATTQITPQGPVLFPFFVGSAGGAGQPYYGGTSGFGVDLPISTPFSIPIPPEAPGTPNVAITTLPGNAQNIYSTNNPAAPAGTTPGIGPVFSVAIDNTLGSFSPFQGRVYVAYTVGTGIDTNIQLVASDDPLGAATGSVAPSTFVDPITNAPDATSTDHWTTEPALGQVNDDAPGDNFTEGNRTQFNPEIAVDPVTGTLGLMWYDGRFDAAHTRLANAFTTSIDGGVTFAPDAFLNTKQTATDFYTGATVSQEPIPDNMTLASALGFGDRSGLIMYGGHVYPAFSGNYNQPPGNFTIQGINATPGSLIFTNTVTIAGGPRLLTGAMGPIVNDFNGGNTDYNNTFTTDNTRQLNGFVLTFDRPVDPATLTPGLITFTYRDPNTPAGSPGTDLTTQITGITPLDLSAAHGPNASGTPPSFSISDTIIQEPFSGRTMATFTVVMSQGVGTPVAVDWATQDDTGSRTAATSTGLNPDYVASHGTLVFNPGQVTASFQVPVLSDPAFTSNRHFLVNLTNAPAAIVIDRAQGKATIISDQNVPAITVGNAYAQKNSNGPFTYNGQAGTPITLTSITTAAQVTAALNAIAALNGNVIVTGNVGGPFTLTFTGGTSPSLLSFINPGEITVTSATTATLSVNPVLNFPVFLNAPATTDITVDFSFSDGTAKNGVDYLGVPGTLTILKGSTTGFITASAISSQIATGNLSFFLNLTNPVNASVTQTQATGVIVDDNALAVSVGDVTIQRSATPGNATVTFYLNGITSQDVTVLYRTVAGTAVDGTDYIGTQTGSIVIPKGTQSKTVQIVIPGSTTAAVNKNFQVQIVNVINGAISATNGTSNVTIVDDNQVPAVFASDAIVRQNLTGATTMVDVPLLLNYVSPTDIKLNIQTSANTTPGANQAVAGRDYIAIPPTDIIIPAGTLKYDVLVSLPTDLNVLPLNPTFDVTINSVGSTNTVGNANATIARQHGIVTIVSDTVQVSVGDVTVREGSGAQFGVYLSGPSELPIAVTLATGGPNDTAVAGTDYTASTRTVTFAPGQIQAFLPAVPTLLTGANNANPIFFTLNVTGVKVGGKTTTDPNFILRGTGTGTIVDTITNGTGPFVTVGDATVVVPGAFSTATLNFPIIVSPAVPAITVTVTIGAGVGVVTNLPNAAGQFVVSVPVNPNNPVGLTQPFIGNRTVTITVSAPSVGTMSNKANGTGTVIDDNATTVNLGNTAGLVGRDPTKTTAFNFPVVVSNLASNFTPPTSLFGTYATADGTATVAENDYVPVFANQFFFQINNKTSDQFNVPVAVTGTTTPELGQAPPPDYETFTATLSNTTEIQPQGAYPGKATGTAYIIDDNLINLSVSDTSVQETPNGATMDFFVYLNGPSGADVTFTWTLNDGTAKANQDYGLPLSRTETIPAGSLFKKISIPIAAEAAFKGNRFFTMTLSKPTNAGIQKAVGTGTIMDNELTPTLTLSDAIVKKGPSGQQLATFTVFANYPVATPAAPTGVPTTVTVLLSDLTATAAENDYVNTPITVTLPAGATQATFTVPINGDIHAEGNETFRATLSNPSNGDLLAPRVPTPDKGVLGEGIGTIVDFNSVTALDIGDLVVTKGLSGQQVKNVPIYLTTPSSVPVTVQVDTSDGTATVAHHDYLPIVAQTFTIPANTTTFNVPVTILGNSDPTGDLNFFVTLSNPQNATVAKSLGSVTIVDPNSVLGATQFLVSVKPQSAVGTYSYSVAPLVSDRIQQPFAQGGAHLTISDVTVQDNATEADFTLLLSQANPQAVTVQVSTADGTAVAGRDYLPLVSQIVTFAAGSTTAIVRVPLVNIGATIEPLRTFTLSAANLTLGGSILAASSILDVGTASIVDRNDQSQTFWSIGDGISRAGAGASVNFKVFTNQAYATWTSQGPSPDLLTNFNSAGGIESIAVDPNNAAHIVIGAVNGGIWQTFNADPTNPNAITWTPIGDNLKSLSIGDVVFDATDTTGKTFYVGTGRWSNGFQTGGSAVGLYKTTDGGQTWTLLGQSVLAGHRIRAIDVSGQTILVGTVNGTGTNADPSRDYSALGGGLFRSTDGGNTFVPVVGAGGNTLPSGSVVSVVTDPNVAGRVYVAVGGQGIYRSDNVLGNSPDSGIIWTPVNTGLANAAGSLDVEVVGQSVGGATTLYAGVVDASGTLTVYTSTNAGNQWTSLAALPLSFNAGTNFAEKFNLVADPTTGGVVYVDGESGSTQGTPGILRYNPANGGSWVEIDSPGTANDTAPHPDSRDLEFLGNNVLLESDDGGIYVLQNPLNSAASDWKSFNGNLIVAEFNSISYDSTNNILFGSTQDNGSPAQTAPGSLNWTDLTGGDGQVSAVDTTSRANGDVLRYVLANNLSFFSRLEYDNAGNLVSTTPVGLRSSINGFQDGGLNFIDQINLNGFRSQPFVLNNVDPRLMMLGYVGVYEDADPSLANGDAGDVITEITSKVGAYTGTVSSLVYGGFRAGTGFTNVALVGTSDGHVFFRGETGTAFAQIDGTGAGQLGGSGPIDSIAVDPADWRAVYVIRNNQLWFTPNITALAANPFRVIGNGTSDNLGQITTELTTVNIVRIGSTSLPLVGAQGGIYRMLSPGSWSLYGQGLPNVVVHSIAYNPAQDLLVAGTYGRGAWTITSAFATLLSTAPPQTSTAQTILITTNDPSGNIAPLTAFPVTIPANANSTIVSIPLKPGVVLPANLTFTVSISSPSTGVLGQKPVGTGIVVADTTFDTTRLSATPINWQAVVPQHIVQGNTVPSQQNVPINAATLPVPLPPKPSVPYVATSTINISGISAEQVLRDMTVTVNAEFPDTSGLLVQLIAPNNGPTFTLSQNEPGSNFPDTVFDDQAPTAISKRTTSSVETVTVDATGGTFTLAFNGSLVTAALPFNASAAVVQAALDQLLTFNADSVTVTLQASKDPNAARVYTVTMQGFTTPPLLTANGNPLTGKSHSATVAPLAPPGTFNSFRPDSPLSAVPLAANQLNGTWTLKITNSSTLNFGTLANWSLRLQTGVFSSSLTPNAPDFSGSLGNAMDQLQQGFTGSLTRDPTSIFAVPNPVGGAPYAQNPPFLSPPYDPTTLPLIIPGPHQDVIKYTTSDIAQTLTFGPGVTGGTFTLTFNGKTTAPIAWSANTITLQSNIQAALDTLSTIGHGNTAVSNASNPTITFVSALSGTSVPNLTFDSSGLIGGGIASITRAAVGTPTNPLDLAIPQAINNPHTNVVTPGVLNVPIVVANAPIEKVLTGLTVRVDIQHPFAADLRLSLVAPDGTTVLLSNENGLGGPNFDGTTFDDHAGTAITAGAAPFQGTYVPEQPLSTFNGKNINGTWTLKVEDMKADGQHGQVLYWQLIPTSDLVLNQRTSYTDVVFDRQINLSTIDATNVQSMFGPIGQVFGPVTITANPTVPGTNTPVYPSEFTNRVFRVGFSLQQYSGSYSVVIGPVNNAINPSLNKTIQDLAGNAIDNNLNAGLYVAKGASPTQAATSTKSYSTPVINQVFNPGGAAFSTITVPDDYIITQNDINHIQLQLAIQHQNTPDLIATLTAPDGTVAYLFSHPGTFGAVAGNPHPDLGNTTTFDDFAANLIQNSSLGLVGSYKPQTPLSLFVGKNAKGTWALTIFDEAKNPANPYSIGTASGILVQWSLTLPFGMPGTGLGETGADAINTGFRIFTSSPSNTLSSSVWMPIGPAPENGSQTGPVGAITVDPADSTGNTVYAGAAKGGVWKTNNFLTTNPKGPNWVPLTDLGPLNGLNIGTITAVASPDGDPNKTTILAGTGTAVAASTTSNGLPITNSGIGFLRSTDSGRTWQVIDSSNANVSTDPVTLVQTALPISSTLRNHLFDGTAVNKIVVDPTQLNSKYVIYAAISGTAAANSGLFRSIDSGVTWTQVESGLCTDVVLAGGSGGGGTGQLQVLYAGFMTGLGRTGGVYFSSSALSAPNNTLLPVPNNGAGAPGPNQGVNSRVNIDPEAPPFPTTVITVGNPTNNPSGTTTPIVLATPAKTNQPLKDALYQGWVYAYTNNTLYETKDFGQNWTQVNLPITSLNPLGINLDPTAIDKPTDDTTKPNFTLGAVKSIVIDPNNPNIIYVGGTNPIGFHGLGQNQNNGTASSVVRVDLTNVSDVYSFVNNDYSDATGTIPLDPGVGDVTGTGPGAVFHDFGGSPTSNVLSMLRDPANPFLAPSSLQFTNTFNFTNDGSNIHWQFFDFGQGNVNQMVDITDPLTGNIRLVSATSSGVYTGVDIGEGTIDPGIGSASSVSGSRIGNLQVADITDTGAQPSVLAGAISGALLFAENPGIGTPMADPNIFQDGNISWRNLSSSYGEAIVPDPSGSGTVFRYQYPYTADYPLYPTTAFSPLNGNDFFQVNAPGTVPAPTDTNANGTASATTGLIQAGDFPSSTGAGQWPGLVNQGSNFAVNPLGNPGDFQGMVISSRAGRIFRASNINLAAGVGGIVWQDIGDPGVLDGSYAPAVAFGSAGVGAGNVDDFIYAGTLNGHVFVTRTGGGTNWLNISNGLDGSPVLAISADPTRGSNKVFAITQNAVYYLADSSVANPAWVRLSDTAGKTYIFKNVAANQAGIQRPVWNNSSDLVPAFNAATGLTALAVDWRFAVADNFALPNSPTHPILYVGADGGVVTSNDLGKTWTIFPNLNLANSASQTGGYLPSVRVTDLKLILGNVNPVTGVPDSSTGLNMLVASTYGRGDFAIRLDNSLFANDIVIPNSGPQVASIAPATGTFGEFLTGINVTFKGAVDPTSFTPGQVSYVIGPNGRVPVQYVLDTTPNGGTGTGDLHNIYTIQFLTPQTASGTYTVLFGPGITDFSGNLMNQNGNSINGEFGTPGLDDEFLGSVTFSGNTAPTLSAIGRQQTAPGSTITISFTVGDANDPAASLTLTPPPTSSNTDLVPDANIFVGTVPGTNGTGRTLTITPVGNQAGSTFITLTVTDPHGLSATETFEVIFAPPVVLPANPGPQTIPHGQTLTLPFNVTGSPALTLTVNATAISPIYNLWTQKQFFQSGGTYYQNTLGLNEKWVFSKTAGVWYVIQPTGAFSIWNGGKSITRVLADQFGNPLMLDNSYWLDPTKITAPAAPITFAGSVVGTAPNMKLQITPPLGYAGPATVTVTGVDGLATSSLTFALTVTNIAPTFNTIGTPPTPGAIPVVNLPPSQANLVLQMAAAPPAGFALTDPDDGVAGVTLAGSKVYAANAAGTAYELSQTYGLYYTGNYYFNSEGLGEKWLQSTTTGDWYIIQASGAFSHWNGGTSFTQFATLDSSYWLDPTKIVLAPEPAPLPNVAVDDVNHVLTITPAAQEIVKVSASDGQATTKQFFNLTVTTVPPVFNVPDQQVAHNKASNPQLSINLANEPANPVGAINLSDPNGLPLTTTLAVYNYIPGEAYKLSTTLDLQFHTSNYQDTAGLGERWLFSNATSTWYIIEPNGNFSKWNGGTSFTFVAKLDFSYWNNLNSLININDGNHVVAPAPLASTSSFNYADNANVLTFNTDGTVAGNFLASVTAADTLSSTTKSFEVSFTDVAPTFFLGTPGATTISHTASYDATITNVTDGDTAIGGVAETPTFSANVYPYVPGLAYELQHTYGFYTTGNYYSTGTNPKWFRSAANNSWYTIDKSGVLSKWNLGTSFTPIGTLDATYYADPTKLFNSLSAPAPLNPAAITAVFSGSNAAGYDLHLQPINTVGNLLVQVNANDTAATTSQYFALTVTSPTPTFTVTPQTPSVAFTNVAMAIVNNISAAPDSINAVTFTANVYPLIPGLAYQLNQLKNFVFNGSYYLNNSGLGEKWVYSNVENNWYIIEPTGKLSKWNGGSSFTQVVLDGVPVVLGPDYWADPTKLLNATTPPADLAQTGTFTASFAGSNATGLSLTINPNGKNAGNYLIAVNGSDAGAVTTQYFMQNFSDFAPTFGQPADQSIAHAVATYTLDLTNPASFANPSAIPSPTLSYAEGIPPGNLSTVTVASKAYYATSAAVAYELDSEFNLFTTGNLYFNAIGLGEKWVRSHVNNQWYIIEPGGRFSLWNGGTSVTFVAQLDSTYYADPTKLFGAAEPASADTTAPPLNSAPGASSPLTTPAVLSYGVNNNGHTVTVNTDPNFVGALIVKVTAKDPAGLATSQFFKLSMTSLTPTLAIVPPGPLALSKAGTPLTVELVGNDPDSNNTKPLNYVVTVTDVSAAAQAFALQQAQNLFVDGSLFFNYYGQQEIWLRSHATGAWYTITPDGTVRLLDPAHLLGPVVANLGTAYYNNYNLLLTATNPGSLALNKQVSAAADPANPNAKNLTLNWTNPSAPASGTFPVLVSVTVTNAVGSSTTQTFVVNVS